MSLNGKPPNKTMTPNTTPPPAMMTAAKAPAPRDHASSFASKTGKGGKKHT